MKWIGGIDHLQKGTIIKVKCIIGPTAELVLKPLGDRLYELTCEAYVVGRKLEKPSDIPAYLHLYQAREYEPGRKISRGSMHWLRLKNAVLENGGGIQIKVPYGGEPLHYDYEQAIEVAMHQYLIVRESDIPWYLARTEPVTERTLAMRQERMDWARAGIEVFTEMAKTHCGADVNAAEWNVVVMDDLDEEGQARRESLAVHKASSTASVETVTFRALRKSYSPERIVWYMRTPSVTHPETQVRFVYDGEQVRMQRFGKGKWRMIRRIPPVYTSEAKRDDPAGLHAEDN